MRAVIAIDRLRELLAYDPETGVLTWLVNVGQRARAGNEAGGVNGQGYREVTIDGKRYQSNRLAFALTHGVWPAGQIDHIDGIRDNNRFDNLRDASQSANGQNRKQANPNNRSGSSVPGVSWDKVARKFEVKARRDGRQVRLGRFSSLSDAESASLAYRRANYEGFTL